MNHLDKKYQILLIVLIWGLIYAELKYDIIDHFFPNSKNEKNVDKVETEVVKNGGFDGGVWQVKSYLKRNLNDPKSLEIIDWFQVQKNSNGTYSVRCKYRFKNSFGGYEIANEVFIMDYNGNVIDVRL